MLQHMALNKEVSQQIVAAYDGEIYGIAFFDYFTSNYADASRLSLWNALIEVEVVTAQRLQAGLMACGVEFEIERLEMQQKGKKDAAKWIDLAWPDLTDTLLPWIAPYEVKYREWAEQARQDSLPHTQALFDLIADHETAIYQCWQQEQNGRSGMAVLQVFVQQYKAI